MNDAMVLNNPYNLSYSMPNVKREKKKTISALKEKLEQAKLNLIYEELAELNITFERNYETVDELLKDLKNKVDTLTYNKIQEIINKVTSSLNTMVSELENSSTNAFTKIMTSDLSKTIAKSLGISLAGRTALLLAPTIASKAIIATGLAGYGLYKVIKNRKQVIEINETNEINNILQDLEVTKDSNNKYLDTRFNENIQTEIRSFLKNNGILFTDTGYRSLRQTIYSLDNDKKKALCNILNEKLGKGIDIDKRISKARRQLNVIASSATGISSGVLLGIQAANTINSIDPAITAGILNGTVLGAWAENVANKSWFTSLSSGIGLIGSEIIEHIPVIGDTAKKIFSIENLASFATIGAAGGIAVGMTIELASAIKRIYDRSRSKKENQEYLKLDSEKYGEFDKKELEKISEKIHTPKDLGELAIIDIVVGYLNEEGIVLPGNIKTTHQLKEVIKLLPNREKQRARTILNQIENCLNNDSEFINKLKKAGKISIALFTSGLAAMSVYDIIKGGTFLPEVSKKLFPENNIYNPIEFPKEIGTPYDLNNLESEREVAEKYKKIYSEFYDEKYFTLDDADYYLKYSENISKYNPGLASTGIAMKSSEYAADTNFINRILGIFGGKLPEKKVPNITAISEKLNALSDKELYEFYRFFNNLSGDTPVYNAVKSVLGYSEFLKRAENYIQSFHNQQNINNLVVNLSNKVSAGAIPLSTALSTLGIINKNETSDNYGIDENEIVNEKTSISK